MGTISCPLSTHYRRNHPPVQVADTGGLQNVWQFLRSNWLSNLVFDTYDEIIDAACDAWRNLEADPERITSIGMRIWAHVGHSP